MVDDKLITILSIICIIINIFVIIFAILSIINSIKRNKQNKKILEELQTYNKNKFDFSKSEYKRDSQYLIFLINSRTEYLKSVILPTLVKDKNIINDDLSLKLINNIVTETLSLVSDDYRKQLEYYMGDLEKFLIIHYKSVLEPFCIKNNIKILRNINIGEDIDNIVGDNKSLKN